MTHGFQSWNSDGGVAIASDEVAVRFVASVLVERTFSGTISIPKYDSSKGTYFIFPYTFKWNLNSNSLAAETASMPGNYILPMHSFQYDGGLRTNPRPTTSWNNTTKLLTFTPNGTYSPWRVLFIHHL